MADEAVKKTKNEKTEKKASLLLLPSAEQKKRLFCLLYKGVTAAAPIRETTKKRLFRLYIYTSGVHDFTIFTVLRTKRSLDVVMKL